MVRPLRIDYEGAYYHVMNRGRGRQLIFHVANTTNGFSAVWDKHINASPGNAMPIA